MSLTWECTTPSLCVVTLSVMLFGGAILTKRQISFKKLILYCTVFCTIVYKYAEFKSISRTLKIHTITLQSSYILFT